MPRIYEKEFYRDDDENPTGGKSTGTGFEINWQNGIVKDAIPNGASVEFIIIAVLDRLKFFQDSKFNCRENALAITKMEEALLWLSHRTQRRTSEETENTYQLDKGK